MKKASVYTRTGDKGLTGLVGGTRISKGDPRIHLYGEVDELNSQIGFAMSFLPANFDIGLLQKIQSSLFDLGSNLACEKDKRDQFKLPQISEELIKGIEDAIDKLDSELAPLKHFILPGGHPSAAAFHVCRTVCRRVERQMVEFESLNKGEVPAFGIEYVNRLSDYFFILSRNINHHQGINEKEWIPN
jgi:cob(I)alamin adenosyltransferase